MKGPFASLAKSSQTALDPKSRRDITVKTGCIRHLTLDLAATLARALQPRLPQQTQRLMAGNRNGGGQKGSKRIEEEAEVKRAADSLRLAVSKAVAGTDEDLYWRGISGP